MTQNEQILQHLEKYGSITPMEAVSECGCMRLAARIADLKDSGHNITTTICSGKNRNGEKVRYAEYKYKKPIKVAVRKKEDNNE